MVKQKAAKPHIWVFVKSDGWSVKRKQDRICTQEEEQKFKIQNFNQGWGRVEGQEVHKQVRKIQQESKRIHQEMCGKTGENSLKAWKLSYAKTIRQLRSAMQEVYMYMRETDWLTGKSSSIKLKGK